MTDQTNQEANVDATNQGADTSKEVKTFTQEDFDAQLSKTLKERDAEREKRMQQQLKQEREEWERQSKLSEEQRAEEQRKD